MTEVNIPAGTTGTGWRDVTTKLWHDGMGRTGVLMAVGVVALAVVGPLVAPYDRAAVAASRAGILQPPAPLTCWAPTSWAVTCYARCLRAPRSPWRSV